MAKTSTNLASSVQDECVSSRSIDSNGNRAACRMFADKLILAPMVRENSLPFRLLCLKYGADLVYTEELIDYRLSSCRRLENKALGTVDFVDDRGEVIFRTCADERGKVVLQIGSNNPDRALKAAKIVSQDVVAIDFNFGCPKAFSLSGGMGAALLEKPDQIESLLTACVKNLRIPVTCKIRLLPERVATLKLVKLIESCGVSAIGVHGRTKNQRPQHENNNQLLREISGSISIPMIANGGSNHIKSHLDICKFREETGASSVMIARASMKNPSIFKVNNTLEPINDVIVEFIKLAVRYNNYVANTKYAIQAMMANGHFGGDFVHAFHATRDLKTICDLFGLSDWYVINRIIPNKADTYGNQIEEIDLWIREKVEELHSRGLELICDNIQYVPKVYGNLTPKAQLLNYVDRKSPDDRPKFEVFSVAKRRFHCIIEYDGKCYLNKTPTTNKKASEQATAIVTCERLCLVDLNEYKDRIDGCNRNIN